MSFRSELWTMRSCLNRFASKYADREKVVFPDANPAVRWTGAEFNDEVDRVAAGYRRFGLEKDDRVGLIGLNTPKFVAAYFGAVKSGLVPCIFNPRESPGRLTTLGRRLDPAMVMYDTRFASKARDILEESAPRVLVSLTDDEPPLQIDRSGTRSETLARLLEGDKSLRSNRASETSIDREDTAFINWSTGTTGVPKGLVWTNEGAVAAGVVHSRARKIDSSDVRLNYSTPGFIGWFYATFPNMVAGATLVFMEQFDPERYLKLIESERVTDFGGVSTPVRMALEEGPENYDLSSVESAFYVGETIESETIERIQAKITPNVYSLYGTTEAAALTGMVSGSDDPRVLSDELPLVEARVVELRDGNEKAPPDARVSGDEHGELILHTPARAERVLDDPQLTADVFRDGWWYSGDIAECRPDGTFRIVGRADDMIISGGINVFPSLVEDSLTDYPDVADIAVVGLSDDQWGERVVAVIRTAADIGADELDAHCRDDARLPRHARPQEYYFWDEHRDFPTTPTGKIYRAALRRELASEGGIPTDE